MRPPLAAFVALLLSVGLLRALLGDTRWKCNLRQLKIDAQGRQIKRQEEDLATLREERELQLVRAYVYHQMDVPHTLTPTTCEDISYSKER